MREVVGIIMAASCGIIIGITFGYIRGFDVGYKRANEWHKKANKIVGE